MSQSVSQPTSAQIPRAAYGRGSIAAALLCSGLLCASAAAQAQTAVRAEGALQAVTDLGGGNGSVLCNGATIQIVPGIPITSPTTTLTMAQLADPTLFVNSGFNPVTGAARAGFIGGHCVVNGVRNDVTGVITADSVFQEIVEDVLLGAVTNSPALGNGAFAVLGTPAVPLTDPRMSATKPAAGFYGPTGIHAGNTEQARNQFGFGVDLNTVGLPAPDVVSLLGYFGNDNAFHAHTIDTTNGTLLAADSRPSITRSVCKNTAGAGKDSLDTRGGCILATPGVAQTVTMSGHTADGTLIQVYTGTATCAPDPAFPPFGKWVYSNSKLTYAGDACPEQIRVTLTGAPDNRRDFIKSNR